MAGKRISLKPRAKKKPPAVRRYKTGVEAAPVDDGFRWFKEYFRLDLDRKEVSRILRDYIKDNYKGEERTLLLSAPDYWYSGRGEVAASITWRQKGMDFPDNWDPERHVKHYIDQVRHAALTKIEKANDPDNKDAVVPTISPMERVKAKTSAFIGRIDEYLDTWEEREKFSLFNEMTKEGLSSFSAVEVLAYYKRIFVELRELVDKKTPELVEAYSHWSVPQRKKYFAFVSAMVSDADKYVLSKKAQRKPSKPRVKSADKQVKKLNFAKDSAEFKLTSIDPTKIVGAQRLYTFHVKERIVTEFVTNSGKGFEISGSTLKNFTTEKSRSIRLRKPEDTLVIFLRKTAAQIDKEWSQLTTKTTTPTGRINKDMILLRVIE